MRVVELQKEVEEMRQRVVCLSEGNREEELKQRITELEQYKMTLGHGEGKVTIKQVEALKLSCADLSDDVLELRKETIKLIWGEKLAEYCVATLLVTTLLSHSSLWLTLCWLDLGHCLWIVSNILWLPGSWYKTVAVLSALYLPSWIALLVGFVLACNIPDELGGVLMKVRRGKRENWATY